MAISHHQKKDKSKIVRLNLQLPLDLKESLDQRAAKLNTTTPKLVREFLQQGLEILAQKEIDQQLISGYRYLAKENRQLLEEFRAIDLEDWEEDNANNS